ncbi:MAG: hypothetical protein HYZ75_03835 [Elusimicrobia bacterium]|nr:hypothetical protein [Elusimicrobiota bacterium]
MIQLLMLLSLIPAGSNQLAKNDFEICQAPRRCAEAPLVAQVQPCVWPRTCGRTETPEVEVVEVAKNDFEICQAPRRCGRSEAQVAQYRPCVWPNTCAKEQPAAPVVAQVQPCVWPRTCGRSLDV